MAVFWDFMILPIITILCTAKIFLPSAKRAVLHKKSAATKMYLTRIFAADAKDISFPKGDKGQSCGIDADHLSALVYSRKQRKPVGDAFSGKFHIAFFCRPDLKKRPPIVFFEEALLPWMKIPAGNSLFFAGALIL